MAQARIALFASSLLFAGAAHAQGVTGLGKVNFPNSCSPAVQEKLQTGVAMLHSFYYSATKRTFEEVAQQDPGCAIAAWGYASILMSNPLAGAGASPKDAADAQAVIEKGRRMGAKTQRERDCLEAVAAYYENFASRPERERQVARAKAYEALAAKYPGDDEAQIFYAVYLAGTQLQTDQTYGAYLKAAKILEEQFKKHPQHPGAAHYLIHSYDAPPIARQGIPAARRYSEIAPDAPHALHMPSHIFTRVGAWQASIDSNRASAKAAQDALRDNTIGLRSYESLHAYDYMMYAFMQLAKDREAKAVMDEVLATRKLNVDHFAGAFALAAIPARYTLERGRWADAAALTLTPGDLAWDKFPQAESITWFARGIGAARSGDVASAKKDLERIAAIRDRLTAAKNTYWAEQSEIQRLAVAGWIARAEGRNDEAVALLRQAATREDATEKHPVTPGALFPAREMLADMLLELGQPAAALVEIERSHKNDPNRFLGLWVAGRAAELAGNPTKARQYYGQLLEMAKAADGERVEIKQARAFLGR